MWRHEQGDSKNENEQTTQIVIQKDKANKFSK